MVKRLKDIIIYHKGKKPAILLDKPTALSLPYLTADYFRNGIPIQFVPSESLSDCVICSPRNIVLIWDGSKAGDVFSGLNGVLASTMIKIEPREEHVLKDYVLFYLKTQFKNLNNQTTGSSIPHIRKSLFEDLQVAVPSLETQRQIVAILGKAEETRRLRAQADELAARLTNNIFLKMFGNPIKNPKDWPKIKLGDLCEIRRGASPRPIDQFLGGTVPWIKIGDGTKGSDIYIEETEEKIIEKGVAKSVFLKEGSLIFANCGVSLGFARILKIDGCIHDGWLSLDEINPMLNKIYILKLINMLSTYFRESAPDGTQPNLNTTIMKNFKVPVPPLDLQNKFAQMVNEVELFKQGQQNSKEKIDDFIGLLMQKAFTGELVA